MQEVVKRGFLLGLWATRRDTGLMFVCTSHFGIICNEGQQKVDASDPRSAPALRTNAKFPCSCHWFALGVRNSDANHKTCDITRQSEPIGCKLQIVLQA